MVRSLALAGALLAAAAAAAVPAAAAQPPGDAAANLAGSGKLDAALALLDTWLADHPNDPRMFPMLLQVVTAAPQQPTVDAVVTRYRNRLAGEQVAVLRAAPADLAELRGGVEQALQALELPGVGAAAERRAVLLLELGEVTLDTAPAGMAAVHAGLARFGEGLGEAGLEPSLRAAFEAPDAPGAGGAVAGYGLVSLLAANGRADAAAAVLEQMRRRYPRSPEYALAAAELQAGAAPPRVVALPSPAMLLGSLAGACRAPCPPPAGALLAGTAERARAQPPAAAARPAGDEAVALPQPAAGSARAEPDPASAVAFVAAAAAAEPAVLVPLPEPELPAVAALAAEQAPAGPEPALPRPEPAPQVRVLARPAPPVTAADGLADAPATPNRAGVRVAAQPDPAAFIVQTGVYRDPDNALKVEHRLAAAGFAAQAHSYRLPDGIAYRVTVGGTMTRTQAEQLAAQLRDAGYESHITLRDDSSPLPPPPPAR